ncbi:MAG: hypothetical protein U0792_18225 [Gemmataceae bacterium]
MPGIMDEMASPLPPQTRMDSRDETHLDRGLAGSTAAAGHPELHCQPARPVFHALRLRGRLHQPLLEAAPQHGPLFNYGPYYGYPPFEPYGPWNAYLQYNPRYYGTGNGGGGRGGHGGHCGHCGWHAPWKQGGWFANCGHIREGLPGWFHGKHCRGHCGKASHSGSCSTCAAPAGCAATPAAPAAPASNPMTRISGVGSAGDSAVFYAGLPSLDSEATRLSTLDVDFEAH